MTLMGSEQPTDLSSSSDQTAAARHQQRLARQRLQSLIGNLAGAAIGCAIVILSVVNISLNLIEFRQTETPAANWWYAIPFIALTGVLPLLGGFWLLFGCTNALGVKNSVEK